ncbi:conserved hypothetical protein [Ahrensia sp. R2A130]|nr:conserved hypothetical protein [Ahrensia sp. R2A130]
MLRGRVRSSFHLMLRGPLGEPSAVTRFSGHETFPLRRLWLRKAYEAVREAEGTDASEVFDKDAGIIRFGVGKNMVFAIRHWARICRVIEEDAQGHCKIGPVGNLLFHSETGVDPYLENIASTWLLHWIIASDSENATTWYYAFNHLNAGTFDRETIASPLRDLCLELSRSRASAATIKRDVEVFVRSYVSRIAGSSVDDQVETVLSELNLVREVAGKAFEFRRGPKPSLPDGVFAYALHDFWSRKERLTASAVSSISVEEIAFEPGSPGRIFKMNEDAVIDRLVHIDRTTSKAFVWSDTAGVRNVSKRDKIDPYEQLRSSFSRSRKEVAA